MKFYLFEFKINKRNYFNVINLGLNKNNFHYK